MPDCTPFRIYVGDSITELMPIVMEEMKRHGASVSGGGDSGTFSVALPVGGYVTGTYRVDGKSVAIEIESRPAAVSCGTLESKLQDFVLDAKAILRNSKK